MALRSGSSPAPSVRNDPSALAATRPRLFFRCLGVQDHAVLAALVERVCAQGGESLPEEREQDLDSEALAAARKLVEGRVESLARAAGLQLPCTAATRALLLWRLREALAEHPGLLLEGRAWPAPLCARVQEVGSAPLLPQARPTCMLPQQLGPLTGLLRLPALRRAGRRARAAAGRALRRWRERG